MVRPAPTSDSPKFISHETGIYISSRPIQRASEFVDLVCQLSDHPTERFPQRPILFRGQKSMAHDLLPKIARADWCTYSQKSERHLLDEFKRLSLPYLPRNVHSLSDLEWLALAQHHGMATRLLDWTDNALAALWFATQECYSSKELKKVPCPTGVVWAFMPQDADFISDKELAATPFTFRRTKVFRPRHFAERIRAQSGWFTVHRYQPDDNRFIAFNKNKDYKPLLRRIEIDGRWFPKIMLDLTRCGITNATIYPDLGGLSAFLNSSIR